MPNLAGLYPAETYDAVDWQGFGTIARRRVRCTACDKVVFSTEDRAQRAADKTRMRVYLGRCGHWHLTSQKEKG